MARALPPFRYGCLAAAGSALLLSTSLTSRPTGILPAEAFDPDLSRAWSPGGPWSCGGCHDQRPNANGTVQVTVTPARRSIDWAAPVPLSVQVTGGPGLGVGGFCMQTTLGSFVAGPNSRTAAAGDAITHVNRFGNSWSFTLRSPGAGLALLTTVAQSVNLDLNPTGDSFGFWGPASGSAGVALRVFFNAQSVTGLGTGCAGAGNHVPVLGSAASARIGQGFTLELHGAPPASPVIALLGGSATSFGGIPLPFDLAPAGAPGCFLRTNMLALAAALATGSGSGGGSASFVWPVPNDASLQGAVLFFQAIVVDAAANAAGLTTTNGLRVTVQ
jgi:hypothetical protein